MGVEKDTCERARKYARNLLETLEKVEPKLSDNYARLIDAIKRYGNDALYYVDIGDCTTALSAASYAEGLLDSLKYLEIIELEWPEKEWERPTVFLAGSFDLLHPGHIDLLEFAAGLGKVHVVIARDETIRREKKKEPILDEKSRLRVMSAIRYVYNARLGDPHDKIKSVEEISPDIIVLGPDQPFKLDELATIVEKRIGKKPRVIRYEGKRQFSGGLKSTSDIIARICQGSYCSSISSDLTG